MWACACASSVSTGGGRALGETTCAQLTCCVTCAAPLLPLLPLAERPRLEVLPWDGVRRRDEVLRLEPEPERGLELLLSRTAPRRFGDRDLREAERSPRGVGDEEPALRACCDPCGGRIEALSGKITSPSFPNEYPPNMNCIWEIITLSPKYPTKLYVNKFHLEGDNDTKCCPAMQQPDSGIGRPDGISKTVSRHPNLCKTKVLRHRASGGETGERREHRTPARCRMTAGLTMAVGGETRITSDRAGAKRPTRTTTARNLARGQAPSSPTLPVDTAADNNNEQPSRCLHQYHSAKLN
ncbi:hypothetical protein HPB49_004301 [Dermacentor silvarum]|uniref:Uncharacterized protein n=1 Tax=Dermacentor silvarum TaxID=543639 RepID=A0ACB8DUH0_DERSI|nr:hypothetical protein HPB49_004301 [Dermacentor silvarum]